MKENKSVTIYNELRIKDLETLMRDTYREFAHWENSQQEEAFEEYLTYFKEYVLLTQGEQDD